MSSGRMVKKLYFQTKTETGDGAGGVAVSWADNFYLFGTIEPRRGRERFFAQRIEGDVTHVITVRYNAARTISVDDRIQYRPTGSVTRNFNIKSIINKDERNRYFEIMAVEGEPT